MILLTHIGVRFKMNSRIVNFISKNKLLFVFLFFVFIYFFSGLFISFSNNHIFNVFDIIFGADCPRVYQDYVNITGDHYRIKVHPFMLIELQPLIALGGAFLHSLRASVFLVQGIAGAMGVVFLILSLINFEIKKSLSYLIGFIYGLSFTVLVFVSVPELYVFGGLFNILFLYYLSSLHNKNQKHKQQLTLKNLFIISILMILNFGIIPINIVYNVILFVWFVLYNFKDDKKQIQKAFSLAFSFFVLIYFAFSLIQHAAYPKSPMFSEDASADKQYTNFKTSRHTLKIPLRNMFVYGFYSGGIYRCGWKLKPSYWPIAKSVGINFKSVQKPSHYLFAIVFLGFPFLYYCTRFREYKKYNSLIFTLFVILALSYFQLYFYGRSEGFMYIQDFFCYLLLLLGLLYNKINKKIATIFCLVFIINMIIANVAGLVKIRFTYFEAGQYLTYLKYFLCSLITTFALGICIWYGKLICVEKISKDKYFFYLSCYLFFIITFAIFTSLFKGAL